MERTVLQKQDTRRIGRPPEPIGIVARQEETCIEAGQGGRQFEIGRTIVFRAKLEGHDVTPGID